MATTGKGVRREKAAFSCGFQSHPAKAPAGSNRSGHGGNDMAEAFGYLYKTATAKTSMTATALTRPTLNSG